MKLTIHVEGKTRADIGKELSAIAAEFGAAEETKRGKKAKAETAEETGTDGLDFPEDASLDATNDDGGDFDLGTESEDDSNGDPLDFGEGEEESPEAEEEEKPAKKEKENKAPPKAQMTGKTKAPSDKEMLAAFGAFAKKAKGNREKLGSLLKSLKVKAVIDIPADKRAAVLKKLGA